MVKAIVNRGSKRQSVCHKGEMGSGSDSWQNSYMRKLESDQGQTIIILTQIFKKLNKNNDLFDNLNEKSLLNKRLVFKTTILINYQ